MVAQYNGLIDRYYNSLSPGGRELEWGGNSTKSPSQNKRGKGSYEREHLKVPLLR
jgi:hypothetical protein